MMYHFHNRLVPIALLFLFPFFCQAQLTVAGGQTPQQLADLLVGPGVTVFNVTLNCPNDAYGTFDGTNTNLNVDNGVLLTSGTIANAALPQTSGSITGGNSTAGDPDLDALSGVQTFDACVLEFDLVATCDTISIAYVFASDEYDEWVCAFVNDAFGFFIDGPGLNNVNIATVPGTNTSVSINSVNNGSIGANGSIGSPNCDLTNSAFFATNQGGTTHEYDGQTIRMEAVTWVQPCSTYHIKLAIADGGDAAYDSGVFLEEGGIQCVGNDLEITTAFTNGSAYLVEGCTNASLFFVREGNLSLPLTIHYLVNGTATNGTDYSQIPDSVVFGIGQDSVAITISAPDDGFAEGIESVFIVLEDSTCGAVFSDTAEILIADPPVADFIVPSGCPGDTVFFTDASFFPPGNIVAWDWDFGDGGTSNLQNPGHAYGANGTFTVSLTIETAEGCRDSISQTISLYDPPTADFGFAGFCLGEGTDFTDQSVPSAGDTLVNWAWDFGDGNSASAQNPSHFYAGTGTYDATLIVSNANGCSDTLTQSLEIYPLPVADFTWTDVCDGEGMPFEETGSIASGSYTNAWDLGDGSSQTATQFSQVYAQPGTYTVSLVQTSDQGCVDSVSRLVTVHPNPVVEFTPAFACHGDTSFFEDGSSILTGALVSWAWDFGDGNGSALPDPFNIYAQPGSYTVSLTVASDQGCATTEDLVVELPPGPPAPRPIHDTICTGFTPELAVVPPAGPGQVFWYYSQPLGAPFQSGNSFSPGPLVNTEVYFTQFVSSEGCPSAITPVFAIVNAPPNVDVTFSNTEVEIPNAIVEFIADVPPNVVAQVWTFGDGGASTAPAAVHQYEAPGVYDVSFSYVDRNGCENEYFWPQHVTVTEEVYIWAPNAVTPNGEGPPENEYFSVETRLIADFHIMIFDRWGKLIYESFDQSFRWYMEDGSGGKIPEGVYVWNIDAVTFRGDKFQKAGTLTVLR